MGEYDKAENMYCELLDLDLVQRDSLNLPVIYSNISSLFRKKQQPDTAIFYLNKALYISTKTKDTAMLTSIYADLGDLYLMKQIPDSASNFYKKSIRCAKTVSNIRNEIWSIKKLIHIDTFYLNNYQIAAQRLEQLVALRDSVCERRLKNNLRTSELQYENQKKSNLIEIQQFEIEAAKKRRLLSIILFILSLLTIGLMLRLIMIRKRNNQREQQTLKDNLKIKDLEIENARKSEEVSKLKIDKIEAEIRAKEQELVGNALALEMKNELLGLINDKVNEAMQGTGYLKVQDMNGIVGSIKAHIRESGDIDKFNRLFNQLHHDFFEKLKKSHPDLTKSEMKFCAYLKLKLTSKQIASIMNVTNEAIRKSRYRIRKKINLRPNESLEGYISVF